MFFLSYWNYCFSCHRTRDEISHIVVLFLNSSKDLRASQSASTGPASSVPTELHCIIRAIRPQFFPLHPDRGRQLLYTPRRCPPRWHLASPTWASVWNWWRMQIREAVVTGLSKSKMWWWSDSFLEIIVVFVSLHVCTWNVECVHGECCKHAYTVVDSYCICYIS